MECPLQLTQIVALILPCDSDRVTQISVTISTYMCGVRKETIISAILDRDPRTTNNAYRIKMNRDYLD